MARRIAFRLLPPTQIGGWGFCTGVGFITQLRAVKWRPSKSKTSPVHAAFIASMASSESSLSSARSTPSASNSGFRKPAPTPMISRPFEMASTVTADFAVMNGFW